MTSRKRSRARAASSRAGQLDRWGQPQKDPPGPYDGPFYEAKGYLESLLSGLRVEAEYRDTIDFAYLPGRTAEVVVGERPSASSARCTRASPLAFDIKSDVAMFEVDLEKLLAHVPGARRVRAGLAVPTGGAGPRADRRRPRARSEDHGHDRAIAARASPSRCSTSTPASRSRRARSPWPSAITFQSPKKTLDDETVARETRAHRGTPAVRTGSGTARIGARHGKKKRGPPRALFVFDG